MVGPDEFNAVQIVDNEAYGTTQPSGAVVSSPSLSADQFASVTIGANLTGFGPMVRVGASGGYMLYITGDFVEAQLQFYDVVYVGSYSADVIGTPENFVLVEGDIVTAEVSGTTLRAKVNGVTVFELTDATYSSGQPGLFFDFPEPEATYFEAGVLP